jgi:hypothetical protein
MRANRTNFGPLIGWGVPEKVPLEYGNAPICRP